MEKSPYARPGNTSGVVHGGRSKRFGIALARLGRPLQASYVDVLRLRRALESMLRRDNSALTLRQVARIQSVARLELSARALELKIRQNPDMPAAELQSSRHSIISWTLTRDKIINELVGDLPAEGNGGPADALTTLLANAGQPAAPSDDSPDTDASDATEATTGDEEGSS